MNGKYVLLIVLALVSVSAYAVVSDSDGADASDGDGVTYAFDSGILTVSGTGAMADYASASDAPWYTYRESITAVVISSGITSIGNYAFYEYPNLVSIDIPDTVVSIGSYAFYLCSGLISVEIPDSVTSIGDASFGLCSSIASVDIGSSVTSIGSMAFSSCTALVSLTIGSSVTSIGDYAFCSCTALSSVIIPDSVKTIGSMAFVSCALEKIYFGTGLTSVDSYAFDITFKDGETEISITDLDSFKGHIFTIDSSTYRTKQTTYRISFVADGTVAAMIPYLSGETVTAPAVPEKEGYTGVWESYELENSDSQTVNAVYTAIMIDVKFLSEDGETVAAEYCLRYGQSIVLPETPVKESTVQYDYVFSGWDGYTAGDTAGVSDVTYTARFEPSVRSYQYTVVYSDAYHNSFLPSVTGTAVYGDSVSPSPAEYPGVEAVRMEIASVGGDGSTSYSAVSSVTVAGEGTVIYWWPASA